MMAGLCCVASAHAADGNVQARATDPFVLDLASARRAPVATPSRAPSASAKQDDAGPGDDIVTVATPLSGRFADGFAPSVGL